MLFQKWPLKEGNRAVWSAARWLLLLLIIIFPYGWLAEQWPLFDRLTDFIFGSEWAHIAGHAFLFAIIGAILLRSFACLRQNMLPYVLILILLGVIQEGLQIISFKHRPLLANDMFDLGVDLLAGAVVFGILTTKTQQKEK